MEYLLSVIIPTKDRYAYLKECINSLVRIGSNELEILIQDNTQSNEELLGFLATLGWPHIKYFHHAEPLSQTDNSNLAVKNSTGRYVCYIGDDDSISHSLLSLAELMYKHEIKACNVNMAYYYWPDVDCRKYRKYPLSFDARKPTIKELDTKRMLLKYLAYGMQDIKLLPRVYHAIISRDILDQIYTISGSYFPGPSPDMANATAASLIINKHFYIKQPLIISGSGYNSAAGMGIRGAHKGNLSTVKQLRSDVEQNWNPRIPKIWLGNTIWPESSLKACEAMGDKDYCKKMNWSAIYARISLKHHEYIRQVINHITSFGEFFGLLLAICRDASRWIIKRALYSMRLFLSWEYHAKEKISLGKACQIVDMHNCENQITRQIDIFFEKANQKSR